MELMWTELNMKVTLVYNLSAVCGILLHSLSSFHCEVYHDHEYGWSLWRETQKASLRVLWALSSIWTLMWLKWMPWTFHTSQERKWISVFAAWRITGQIHNEECQEPHTWTCSVCVEVLGAAFRDDQSFPLVGGHFEDTTCEFSSDFCLHHYKWDMFLKHEPK